MFLLIIATVVLVILELTNTIMCQTMPDQKYQIQLWLPNSHERGILVYHTIYQLNTCMTQGLTCEVRMQVFIVSGVVYANNITLQISSALSKETTEEVFGQQSVPQPSHNTADSWVHEHQLKM